MDEARIGELEVAIADAGALLVQVEKYRRGVGVEGIALRREALTLGDEARRLHRTRGFDDASVRRLLDAVHDLTGRLHALRSAVQVDTDYAAAVAAHAAGDQPAIAALIPQLFDGVEAAGAPAALFHPVPWRRRGRPRPPAELAADVAQLRDEGIPAEGDDLAPGVDGALPAVTLRAEAPEDEPVTLRLAAATLPAPLLALRDTGEVLVHRPRLRAPFTVAIRTELSTDAFDEAPIDWASHRAALVTALAAHGIVVEGG